MTMLCCLAGFVAYEMNWIKQRRAFRAQPTFTFVESQSHSNDSSQPRAPQLLWLFGEQGVAFMTREVLAGDLQFAAQGELQLKTEPRRSVLRAHALFPEATIYATDESGDVAEELSSCWLSPAESGEKR
jgi:hypothetical protein